jgi:4-hydroxybenzoate polyprenyltransferase
MPLAHLLGRRLPEDVDREALVAGRDSRGILIWIAVAFAVLEVATVVLIGVPAALALSFAALFLVGAFYPAWRLGWHPAGGSPQLR